MLSKCCAYGCVHNIQGSPKQKCLYTYFRCIAFDCVHRCLCCLRGQFCIIFRCMIWWNASVIAEILFLFFFSYFFPFFDKVRQKKGHAGTQRITLLFDVDKYNIFYEIQYTRTHLLCLRSHEHNNKSKSVYVMVSVFFGSFRFYFGHCFFCVAFFE